MDFGDIFNPSKVNFYVLLRKLKMISDAFTDVYKENFLLEKIKISKQENRNKTLKFFEDKLIEIEQQSQTEINNNI
jgi:hypothetical protein